jgi:hypothetical protein
MAGYGNWSASRLKVGLPAGQVKLAWSSRLDH